MIYSTWVRISRMSRLELKEELQCIAKDFNLPQKAVDCVKEEDMEGLKCMEKHELWMCAALMRDLAE